VKGSPEAENHATHAKVWSALELGFVLIAAGLLVADFVTYPDNHGGNLGGWPDFIPRSGQNNQNAALGLGWFVALDLAFLWRQMTYAEMMTSINAYNYDLLGRGPR